MELTKRSHKPRNSKQHAVAGSRANPVRWRARIQQSQPPLPSLPSGSDSFHSLLRKQKGKERRKELVVTGRWTSQKKRGATATLILRCAALSHPEAWEKPLSPAAPPAFSEEFISHHKSPSPASLGQVYSLLESRHIPLLLPFSSMPGLQCTR